MLFQKIRIYLGNIAEQVASGIVGIFPDTSGLSAESRKLELNLGELHISFRRNLLKERQRLPAYPGSELPILRHLFADEQRVEFQHLTERECVECRDLSWSDKQVVDHFVADENPVAAVVDDASRRVDGGIYHRVVR